MLTFAAIARWRNEYDKTNESISGIGVYLHRVGDYLPRDQGRGVALSTIFICRGAAGGGRSHSYTGGSVEG